MYAPKILTHIRSVTDSTRFSTKFTRLVRLDATTKGWAICSPPPIGKFWNSTHTITLPFLTLPYHVFESLYRLELSMTYHSQKNSPVCPMKIVFSIFLFESHCRSSVPRSTWLLLYRVWLGLIDRYSWELVTTLTASLESRDMGSSKFTDSGKLVYCEQSRFDLS